MPIAIRCSNLVKRYEGKTSVDAVRGLNLGVEVGECFGLLVRMAPGGQHTGRLIRCVDRACKAGL